MVHDPGSAYYSPSTRIVLVTPPPVNTKQRQADLEARNPPLQLDRLFDNTSAYAQAVKDLAEDQKVAVVDVWTSFWEGCGQKEENLGKYLSDGLHLTRAGYEVETYVYPHFSD
jgi:lysophospholipase L1-like esterase